LTGLAAALQAEKKYAEADGLYVRALGITEKNVGPNDPAVATILERDAAVLEELKKPVEARARRERAEAIRRRTVARMN